MDMITSNEMTMSSLEIAQLTGKLHKHVMRDIDVMLKEIGEGGAPKVGLSSYKSSQNKELPCYNLPKRECLILVSGYSITLRAKIIDRWQELEAQNKPQTSLEVLHATVGKMVELERQMLANKTEVDEKLHYLKASVDGIQNGVNYFTVVGYANYKEIQLPLDKAQKLGRAAAKLSKERGVDIGRASGGYFGAVNTYHKSILDELTDL